MSYNKSNNQQKENPYNPFFQDPNATAHKEPPYNSVFISNIAIEHPSETNEIHFNIDVKTMYNDHFAESLYNKLQLIQVDFNNLVIIKNGTEINLIVNENDHNLLQVIAACLYNYKNNEIALSDINTMFVLTEIKPYSKSTIIQGLGLADVSEYIKNMDKKLISTDMFTNPAIYFISVIASNKGNVTFQINLDESKNNLSEDRVIQEMLSIKENMDIITGDNPLFKVSLDQTHNSYKCTIEINTLKEISSSRETLANILEFLFNVENKFAQSEIDFNLRIFDQVSKAAITLQTSEKKSNILEDKAPKTSAKQNGKEEVVPNTPAKKIKPAIEQKEEAVSLFNDPALLSFNYIGKNSANQYVFKMMLKDKTAEVYSLLSHILNDNNIKLTTDTNNNTITVLIPESQKANIPKLLAFAFNYKMNDVALMQMNNMLATLHLELFSAATPLPFAVPARAAEPEPKLEGDLNFSAATALSLATSGKAAKQQPKLKSAASASVTTSSMEDGATTLNLKDTGLYTSKHIEKVEVKNYNNRIYVEVTYTKQMNVDFNMALFSKLSLPCINYPSIKITDGNINFAMADKMLLKTILAALFNYKHNQEALNKFNTELLIRDIPTLSFNDSVAGLITNDINNEIITLDETLNNDIYKNKAISVVLISPEGERTALTIVMNDNKAPELLDAQCNLQVDLQKITADSKAFKLMVINGELDSLKIYVGINAADYSIEKMQKIFNCIFNENNVFAQKETDYILKAFQKLKSTRALREREFASSTAKMFVATDFGFDSALDQSFLDSDLELALSLSSSLNAPSNSATSSNSAPSSNSEVFDPNITQPEQKKRK